MTHVLPPLEANACLQNANIHNYTAVQTYNIATGAVCTDSAIA